MGACRSPSGSADRNGKALNRAAVRWAVAPHPGARIETTPAPGGRPSGGRRSPSGSADRNAAAIATSRWRACRSPSGSADRNSPPCRCLIRVCSRSPSGSADRNRPPPDGMPRVLRRSPSGSADRNTKGDVLLMPSGVAPHPGARIETCWAPPFSDLPSCRSPSGSADRNKDRAVATLRLMRRSPSGSADRNVWTRSSALRRVLVAPHPGARIETMVSDTLGAVARSLPIRERGSKQRQTLGVSPPPTRRSPSGSADRNLEGKADRQAPPWVAPHPGARIETATAWPGI